MIRDSRTLHLTNLHLHNVLQKASSNQVIKLSLETRVCALELNNIVVKVIYVVFDIIPDWRSGSRFKFKYNWVSVLVFTSCIDLRAK